MKKLLALLLALLMLLSLAGCGKQAQKDEEPAVIELTLWTFPAGDWGDPAAVETLLTQFNSVYPDIHVTVQCLDEATGDDKLSTAVDGGVSPDILLAQPDRLIKAWGAEGMLADLSDMWDDADKQEVNAACQSVCFTRDGKCYAYPFAMNVQCMAINYDAFVAAGADKYVDIDSHTWTTEDFIAAVDALYAYYKEPVGDVYCSGQGGDQGTRALVNNLYGGTFTNAEHTAYTADSPENIKALELLQSMDGIYFNAAENGGEEITAFRQGILKMAFCWNIAQQLNSDNNDAELTNDGEKIVFMSFPSETGESKLQGGIWGFGVFDNGDAAKIDAAKTFIKYFADGEGTIDAVKASKYFAVRDTAEGIDLTGIWADNAIMNEYTKLMPYLGDYYQVTSGWATARTEWWNMLQRIGGGGDVATEVATFCANANAAAAG